MKCGNRNFINVAVVVLAGSKVIGCGADAAAHRTLPGNRFRTGYRTVKSRKRARIALDPAACERNSRDRQQWDNDRSMRNAAVQLLPDGGVFLNLEAIPSGARSVYSSSAASSLRDRFAMVHFVLLTRSTNLALSGAVPGLRPLSLDAPLTNPGFHDYCQRLLVRAWCLRRWRQLELHSVLLA
jgi:hypothetical protein